VVDDMNEWEKKIRERFCSIECSQLPQDCVNPCYELEEIEKLIKQEIKEYSNHISERISEGACGYMADGVWAICEAELKSRGIE
jgi:hypothetical protein